MAKMGYAEARRIRKESLSNRIASKLVGGEGVMSSIGKSISEGTKARMTGLKEKINPMNIAKFMTGGSPLAAAMAGRMMGASKEDMRYFTGKQGKMDTASKIKPISTSQDEGILELLNEIYLLLEDARRAKEREIPTEEEVMERERRAQKRHEDLIKAIKGNLKSEKGVTATKVEEDTSSIVDDVLGALGLKEVGKMALKGLGALATFATSGVGAAFLGAAAAGALGYFFYKVLTDKSGYEAEDSELSKGLKQAEEVGGLAGVLDEMEKRKKLPEYERTMAELKDAEKTYWKDLDGNPQFGTDKQLEGYAKRSPEAAKAVEDYKKVRDSAQKVSSQIIESEKTTSVPASATAPTIAEGQTAAPTDMATAVATGAAGLISPASVASTSTAGSNVTTLSPTATQVTTDVTPTTASDTTPMSASAVALPTETTPQSAVLNNIIKENLEMSLPVSAIGLSGETVNNTVINSGNDSQNQVVPPILDIPSVRNMEETFRRMIVYSTRVV